MDERLQLTEKQQEIIERYNAVVEEMREANILCIFRPYEDIAAFNGEHVAYHSFAEDGNCGTGDVLVDLDSLTYISCPFGLNLFYNEGNFSVGFNEE